MTFNKCPGGGGNLRLVQGDQRLILMKGRGYFRLHPGVKTVIHYGVQGDVRDFP